MQRLFAYFLFTIIMGSYSVAYAQRNRTIPNTFTRGNQTYVIDSAVIDSFQRIPIDDLIIQQEKKPYYTLNVKKTSELKTIQISFTRYYGRHNFHRYIGGRKVQYTNPKLEEQVICNATFFIDSKSPGNYYDLLRLIKRETRKTHALTNRTKFISWEDLPRLIENLTLTTDKKTDKIYLNFSYKEENMSIPVSLASNVMNREKEIKTTEKLFKNLAKARKKQERHQKKLDRSFAECIKKYNANIRYNGAVQHVLGYEIEYGCPSWNLVNGSFFRIWIQRNWRWNNLWNGLSTSSRKKFTKSYLDMNANSINDQIECAYVVYHDNQLISVVPSKKLYYRPTENAQLILLLKDGKKAACDLSELYLNQDVIMHVYEEERTELEKQINFLND